MAWVDITAAETDMNSPVNQTLLDKVRGNLDYLKGLGAVNALTYSEISDGTGATWNKVILDATIDWRGRFIVVIGRVGIGGTEAGTGGYIVGGANDDEIGTNYDGVTTAYVDIPASWMYTEDGGAAYTNNPRISGVPTGTTLAAHLWVNSADGSLNITWEKGSTDTDWATVNVVVFYTGPVT